MAQRLRKNFKENYGEWAVVTGASSGMGRAICSLLSQAGFKLIAIGRNEKALDTLKAECEHLGALEVIIFPCDLGRDPLDDLYALCRGKKTGLLVAAAGYGTSGPFINNRLEHELDMLQVNNLAVMSLTHTFAQQFAQQGFGGIILFGSIVGFQGVPQSANYAASKAYVQSLAEGLYHELKPAGVDVLSAAPGPVASGFAKRANMVMNGAMDPYKTSLEILNALGRKMTVLPGFQTKFLTYSLRTVPRWAKIRIMKMVMGGMTKHQGS